MVVMGDGVWGDGDGGGGSPSPPRSPGFFFSLSTSTSSFSFCFYCAFVERFCFVFVLCDNTETVCVVRCSVSVSIKLCYLLYCLLLSL